MDWSKVNCPKGGRISTVHQFTFMLGGATYLLEVDEFMDGTYTGHGEDSIDDSSVLKSVSGNSVEDCINQLIEQIQNR